MIIRKESPMIRNTFSPLFCDLYHLTMAQAMYDQGTHARIETYEMYIRKAPFEGSYLLTAGLGEVLEWLSDWHFSDEDIQYLRELGFKEPFLKMLAETPLKIDMNAFREGEIVFPNEPIVQVTGPAWQAILLEAGILNIINAQSLFATKASRIVRAACSDGKPRPVLELGLRRAQDMQGFMCTRGAYIGGVSVTSNVEAGRHYRIPVGGTMAHCFIMREESEKEAFKHYIQSFPQQASVLIDTYDTIQGAKNAAAAAQETGIELKSVRLDSGDLAYLAKEVRKVLDDAGCKATKITASSDLDEYTIQSLVLEQGAPIDIFGVGTKLVTSYDQAALGGVYKLKQTGNRDVIKISELSIKTTIPGATDVLRFVNSNNRYAGDVIYKNATQLLQRQQTGEEIISVNPETGQERNMNDPRLYGHFTPRCMLNGKRTTFTPVAYRPMISVVKNGQVNQVEMNRDLTKIKRYAAANLRRLDETHLRSLNPHKYVAGLEKSLYNLQQQMRIEALHGREKS